ncbi:hypothetical protein [Streptomyces sp. NBC_00576]|uniref:hypothetical protein n=1 Tax=Streptomyces sp. NBC_00576 TaxID=2903665 RepID=UPI002E8098C6|nr:hypothetical protein [Streptomyces sp. NBC_00576]WUB71421.1 hypothetical protein OG734_15670 [Streptomyces sp. NBC_00576]
MSAGLAPPTAFDVGCVAYTVSNRSLYELGGHRSKSAWLAMVWLVRRAGHIVDQLDPPAAAPVRAWMSDGCEHARALLRLGQQETYAYTICDGDVRYVLAVAPVVLVRHDADQEATCAAA